MPRIFMCLALVFGLAAIPASAADRAVVENAIERFIVPGYERFTADAEAQANAMEALCTSPGADRLDAARTGFRDLVTSWARIEVVRFGPVVSDNRMERILFWPDRRSIGLKQVQGTIATKDETATTLGRLQEKSVALQGLGALEYVLFGTGSADLASGADAYRCTFGHTIARALAETGGEIVRAWTAPDGIASHMMDPQPDYADYRTREEVMQELLGVWVHSMDMIRDTRIAPFFGETREDSNYKLAPFWRADMTIPSIAANAAGLETLFQVSELDAQLTEMDSLAGDSFKFEFANFAQTADRLAGMPLERALENQESHQDINYLLILTGSLQDIAVQQIGVDLGLVAGFSSLDGD